MLQRLIRIGLMSMLLVASQVWALGLGDIRLSSALNEPLRAEIDLLSATPEELSNVKISLASAETFERYGLDRPPQLTGIQFRLVRNEQAGTDVVHVTSSQPMTEPFLTFLVEAEWPRGRLLREYTVLLDPPTFAPAPLAQTSQPVTAPSQSRPADSGTIARPPAPQTQLAPTPRPAPQPPVASPRDEVEPAAPAPTPTPEPAAAAAEPAADFDTASGGQYSVQRGDTLWQIADRFRPDERLTMNQTMLGIFEANPQAFDGNINRLQSGANLRIPSADEIFRISRGEANAEAERQNEAWASGTPLEDTRQPSLTLIPPDDEPAGFEAVAEPPVEVEPTIEEPAPAVALTDEQRIFEIEQLLLDHQESIIEIQDSELAVLRAELARLKGEEYAEPAAPEVPAQDEPVAVEETPEATPVEEPVPQVVATADQESSGFFTSLIDSVTGFWGILIGGLALAIGTLLFFARRAALAPEDDATGVWNALDADDVDNETVASTQRIRALAQEDDSSIVVVEVDSTPVPQTHVDTEASDETIEPFIGGPGDGPARSPSDTIAFETVPAPSMPSDFVPAPDASIDDSLEDILGDQAQEATGDDTYSSDTAINFDHSDPIAEADFHMAYGLYDQAADLINGALAAEPHRQDLLSKLCETYFVWGNRDAFVDAAARLEDAIGEDKSNSDWDKIIIMGQQIAGDHEMFTGVSAGSATKAVDLSLDADMSDFGDLELDMDLAGGGPDGLVSGVIDLGDDDGRDVSTVVSDDSVDFMFDGDDLAESGTRQMPGAFGAGEETAESPSVGQPGSDATVEAPDFDEHYGSLDATGEMLPIADLVSENDEDIATSEQIPPDATAEIELDDLGLDLGGLSEAQIDEMAGDDLDAFDDNALGEFAANAESSVLSADDDVDEYGETTETPTISQELDSDQFDETAETPVVSEQDIEVITGQNLELGESTAETGKNPEVDVEDLGDAVISTGIHGIPDYDEGMDATGEIPALELPDAGGRDASDETVEASLSMGIDASLLDATGQTQILSGELAVEAERKAKEALGDHEETMLAPPRGDDEETLLAPRRDEDATMVAPPRDDDETMLAPPRDSDDTIEAPLEAGDAEMDDFEFNKTEALPRHAFTEFAETDDTGEMTIAAGSTDMDLDLEDLTAALRVSELQEQDFLIDTSEDETVEQPLRPGGEQVMDQDIGASPVDLDDDGPDDLQDARTMTEVGTKLDLARAYVDMGDPDGARSILEEVVVEGDDAQKQQAQQLLDSLPG